MAQDGKILRPIVLTVSGAIFVHNDIKTPMEPIFHSPMRSDDRVATLGRKRLAEQVISGFLEVFSTVLRIRVTLESVSKVHQGLQSLRSMRRMEAR